MKKAIACCLAAAACLCLGFGTSTAGGASRTHDGLFLRLAVGGGKAGSKIDVPDTPATPGGAVIDLSGTSGDVDFALGGMVQPNLAIHGTIFGWSVSDPDADIRIGTLSGKGTLSGTATMSAIGPGMTYYFMPANLYLTGSLGVGKFKLTGDVEGESKSGFALAMGLGKEWWAGNNWGLGLAGGLTYHSIADKDVSENWSGTSFALRFSATRN